MAAPLKTVRSTLQLRQAAVALHYAQSNAIAPEVRHCKPEDEFCQHFHSYEKDLLSHAFRNPPPLRSWCVPNIERADDDDYGADDYRLTGDLILPRLLRFRTEGETLERHRLGEGRLPVTLSFSRSDFLQSDRSILNLVVHIDLPETHPAFGEYELLCLSKSWSAADDSETLLVGSDDEGVWVELDPGQPGVEPGRRERLETVAGRYLFSGATRPPELIGGCVQIVFREDAEVSTPCATGACPEDGVITTRELLDALNGLQADPPQKPVRRLWPALNAVGCLLQNILDLENVDLNELEDMLEGVSASVMTLTAVHRNTQFAITVNDRLFDDIGQTIGMSPYLLLPQAALLHNEILLVEARQLLQDLDALTQSLARTAPVAGRNAVREQLIAALQSDSFDDLPGSPDLLIKRVVRWLWSRHQKSSTRVCQDHNAEAFVAELDLAVVDGQTGHVRERLSKLLDRDLLGNVFQYVSERWIFEEGARDRGLDSLEGVLRRRTHELDAAAERAEARLSEWRNSNYAVIGLVFTLYTIIPFESAIKLVPGTVGDGELNAFGVLLLLLSGLLVSLPLLWRRILALVYMRALRHVANKLDMQPGGQ